MLNITITGLDAVKARLGSLSKQVDYAASRALNNAAYAINAQIKQEMQHTFKGGATAFTLRAFRVDRASAKSLVATVALRDDVPEGGTSYSKALRHLFNSGTRDWKKLEGYLRAVNLIPPGMMAVPGKGAPLDARGNMRRSSLVEMLGVIRSNIRNVRVYRRTGRGKAQKAVGYFVVLLADRSRLHPGIYKRIETGSSSGISPIIMFVRRGQWRRFIDIRRLGAEVVQRTFARDFDAELAKAVRSAR